MAVSTIIAKWLIEGRLLALLIAIVCLIPLIANQGAFPWGELSALFFMVQIIITLSLKYKYYQTKYLLDIYSYLFFLLIALSLVLTMIIHLSYGSKIALILNIVLFIIALAVIGIFEISRSGDYVESQKDNERSGFIEFKVLNYEYLYRYKLYPGVLASAFFIGSLILFSMPLSDFNPMGNYELYFLFASFLLMYCFSTFAIRKWAYPKDRVNGFEKTKLYHNRDFGFFLFNTIFLGTLILVILFWYAKESKEAYLIIGAASLWYLITILVFAGMDLMPLEKRPDNNKKKRIVYIFFSCITVLGTIPIGVFISGQINHQNKEMPTYTINAEGSIDGTMEYIITKETDFKKVGYEIFDAYFKNRKMTFNDYEYYWPMFVEEGYGESLFTFRTRVILEDKPFNSYWGSENKFGGIIRAIIVIDVKRVGEDRYELVNVSIEDTY